MATLRHPIRLDSMDGKQSLKLDPVRKILVPVPLFRRSAPRLNVGADRKARELMRAYIRMR